MRDRKKNLLRDVHAEPPFRYSDPYRKALRIHTKHIATEDA